MSAADVTPSRVGGNAAPRVSVIIPTHDGARYIGETLDSVLAQTYRDFEVVVVDDGSHDRTRDIVAGYGAPVRLITQPNSGVCAARNRGLSEARGTLICLLDHDDYWFPDKLATQVACMDRHVDVGVVFAAFLPWHAGADGRFPEPGAFVRTEPPEAVNARFSGWIYHEFLLDCWMLTSTAMFRAEVFERCGGFDENLPFSEDWDLWLRIARAYPFIMLRRANTLYRQHVGQGNRVLRMRDYRSELLERAAREWGLCSADGRCVAARRFRRTLAGYRTEFALQHVGAGDAVLARHALMQAWRTYPRDLRPLAYLLASLAGWRPRWSVPAP